MANISALTNPTLIVNGDPVEAAKPNGLVNNTGGLLDTVTILANHSEITTGNSNQTIISNRDVIVYCNNTTNITLTFPLANNQTPNKNIRVVKTLNNTATVTINRSGSDTFLNPWNGLTSNTSFIIYTFGESYSWAGQGNIWVPVSSYINQANYRCKAFRVTNQALGTASFDRVNFNSEVYDVGGFYDNVTNFRATPLIPGLYTVIANVGISNGGSGVCFAAIRKNGALEFILGQDETSANYGVCGATDIIMNGTTDFIDTVAFSGAASKNVLGGVETTSMSVILKARL